ncbi:MAG: LamG domain-containing protein [Proteobacteria bacterium]|nr:LamG domain-containing protein [Pseudomonadota bacterium]
MGGKKLLVLVFVGILALPGGACADLTTGLVGYYPFNGNADDATANHNNGTVHGATLTQDRLGNPNSAYYFNGTDNYIQIPFQTYLDRDQTQGYTVAFWFRFDNNSPGDYVAILDKSHGVPDYNYMNWTFQIDLTDGGARTFSWGGGDGSSWFGSGAFAPIPLDGNWHHAAGTLAGQTFQLFVDGVLKSTHTFAGTVVDVGGDFFIGRHYSLGRYYQGDVDEIRLYQRALSGGEIRQLAGKSMPPYSLLLDD